MIYTLSMINSIIDFQYVSDIHLEYLKKIPIIKKKSNNLCLIGDIGHPGSYNYNTFIKYCGYNYDNVFLIYGNHEYYSVLRGSQKKKETMQQRIDYAKNLPKNVYFLNNSHVYLDITNNIVHKFIDKKAGNSDKYIKIIGSTLWSMSFKCNNFKNIFAEENILLNKERMHLLYNESKNYILKEIDYESHIRCLLLTHYSTHILCNGNYIDHKDNNYIKELFTKKNLLACINGHTHSSIDLIVPGTTIKLLSNCFGYKNEDKNIVKYSENKVFSLKNTSELSFYGIYSKLGINVISLLSNVVNRPNKIIDIGPIDDTSSFVITSSKNDQEIIYVSKSFEELSGYSLCEVKGKNCRFLQDPSGNVNIGSNRHYCDNELLYDIKKNLNSESQFITFNFKKDGTKFINLITVLPVVDNNITYYIGFQSDITTSFMNLINKDDRYCIGNIYLDKNIHLILLLLTNIINRPNKIFNVNFNEFTNFVITSNEQEIIYISQPFEDLTGYTFPEIKDKHCRFLQDPSDDISEGSIRTFCDNKLLYNIKTHLESQNSECQFVTYNFKKDGTKFINLITILPVLLNNTKYFVGIQYEIIPDITTKNIDINFVDTDIKQHFLKN